ncbi:hypothetical protein [Streptomyces sp. MA5143a]|uniref:hypothetical protein n=1 Tax=Streptomyces sp. MA5143a TaxID=2083010 RepID=UPI000D1B68A6|nr:hypothetical protein [Streptomyces sp. MA5143a]SPF05346.1 hypothetical protein SMA5143A_6157 [Streptomyces sp. MA5143a]
MPHDHYLDVEKPAIDTEAGPDKELYFFSGWIQIPREEGGGYGDYLDVGVIDDTDLPNCSARSRRMTSDTMNLSSVQSDQSMCVRSNGGEWAVLKITELHRETAGGSVTFDVSFPSEP